MAKKSAKSKGYRKQTKTNKPYLSKKEIIVLCAVLVAVVIGAILLFSYDDGALKVRDGKVVTDGDNWLIVNGSSVRNRPRYFKVGEVGDIEGYTRELGATTDANVPQYVYRPEDENSRIVDIDILSSHNAAGEAATNTANNLPMLGYTDISEVHATTVNGADAYYLTYTLSPEDAEAMNAVAETGDAEADETDKEAPKAQKLLMGFMPVDGENCFIVRVASQADTLEDCPDDETLLQLMNQAAATVTTAGK